MSSLADEVLPLIRTRAELHRWGVANAHGREMHRGVDLLEAAIDTAPPQEVYAVTLKALRSACSVIARADDSSGIIGDACRRLIGLHPRVAAAAKASPTKLVDWMIDFQFYGDVDYFTLDPVVYAPALGETGMAAYRARLQSIETDLGPRPAAKDRWSSDGHEWFALDHNARRLAVLDRDVDVIIRTHFRDGKVAAWAQDTAEALEEIGEIDLAIEWAQRAVDFDHGFQAERAATHWCRLLEQHRPSALPGARLHVFEKWPSAITAGNLLDAAGDAWPDHRDVVMATLARRPSESVVFALRSLHDPELAWRLAHSLGLDDDNTWSTLIDAYGPIDPSAVLPIHERLVTGTLVDANARNYKAAAQRLRKMRVLSAGTERAPDVDAFIAELRDTHRRRPRLLQEFDALRLP